MCAWDQLDYGFHPSGVSKMCSNLCVVDGRYWRLRLQRQSARPWDGHVWLMQPEAHTVHVASGGHLRDSDRYLRQRRIQDPVGDSCSPPADLDIKMWFVTKKFILEALFKEPVYVSSNMRIEQIKHISWGRPDTPVPPYRIMWEQSRIRRDASVPANPDI